MNVSAGQRILEEIRLLCRCGVGLEPVASPLCDAVRRLIGADAAALFWHDDAGSVLGFCNDYAADELKDLFIERFDELFAPPDGNEIYNLLRRSNEYIGATLEPPPEYFESANFRLLIEPSGYHWPFDCRVDVDGVTRATLMLFNCVERPFNRTHIEKLRPVQVLMRRALEIDNVDARWQTDQDASGTLIADRSGRELIAISRSAKALFERCQMLLYDKTIVGSTSRAPAFVRQLTQMLSRDERARLQFGVVGGRLCATATRTRAVASSEDLIAVEIVLQRSQEVMAVEHILRLSISPLQREIALFAMLGGSRQKCAEEFGITDEALKKHLKLIYRTTKSETWRDLQLSMSS